MDATIADDVDAGGDDCGAFDHVEGVGIVDAPSMEYIGRNAADLKYHLRNARTDHELQGIYGVLAGHAVRHALDAGSHQDDDHASPNYNEHDATSSDEQDDTVYNNEQDDAVYNNEFDDAVYYDDIDDAVYYNNQDDTVYYNKLDDAVYNIKQYHEHDAAHDADDADDDHDPDSSSNANPD